VASKDGKNYSACCTLRISASNKIKRPKSCQSSYKTHCSKAIQQRTSTSIDRDKKELKSLRVKIKGNDLAEIFLTRKTEILIVQP